MSQTATIAATYDRLRKNLPPVDGDPNLGFAANFLYTLTGKRPDDVMEHAFDVALILHADHELNASTFAARVTAATLSDIYSAIVAGIGALKGPLHGGANQRSDQLAAGAGRRRGRRGGRARRPGPQGENARLRPSRLPHGRSARHAPARALRGTGQAHRARKAVPLVEAHGRDREIDQGPQPQRGFLLRRRRTTRWASPSTCTRRFSPSAACPAGRRTCWSNTATTA